MSRFHRQHKHLKTPWSSKPQVDREVRGLNLANIRADIQIGMNRGIYALANGMLSSQMAMDVVSNNLANVNTSGFKGDQTVFNDELERQLTKADGSSIGTMGSGPTAKSQYTDFQQGSLSTTGNPMDFALEGSGMLAVKLPGGQTAYTRNGALTQDANGKIITKDGNDVLDPSGRPITLAPGAFSVNASGEIRNVSTDQKMGQLGIYNGKFTKAQSGYYTSTDAAPQSATSIATTIKQGALESSNVSSITSMVQMINLGRSFEMAQKSIWAEDDMTSKLTSVLTQ